MRRSLIKENEKILKIYRRHFLHWFIEICQSMVVFIFIYFVIFYLKDILNDFTLIAIIVIVTIINILVLVYISFMYYLDKLIITDKRVLFVDWKYLFVKDVYDTELHHITDIFVHQHGILDYIPFLDFGTIEIRIQTSRSASFKDASKPYEIRNFLDNVISASSFKKTTNIPNIK